MKKYWLVLDSYTFLWKDDKHVVFYSSLIGKGIDVYITESIYPIVKQLLDVDNLYCVEITSNHLTIPEVALFVDVIRKNFLGDLYDQDLTSSKPFVMIPMVNLNDEQFTVNISQNNINLLGQNLLNNVLDITLNLSGACSNICKKCSYSHKQYMWCSKNDYSLNTNDIKVFLRKFSKVNKIINLNFIVTDKLFDWYFEKFLKDFRDKLFRRNIIVYCDLYNEKFEHFSELFNKGYNIIVLVDKYENYLNEALLEKFKINETKIHFRIENEHEYLFAEKMITQFNLEKVTFLPFFNGLNLDFFKTHVFLNKEDILNTRWSKKEIYAHQKINTNFFGRLIIDSNGDIYTSINFSKIGNITDNNINNILYQELININSWKLTRDYLQPCKKCRFKYLCPSSSNLEKIINKQNLCHVHI